MNIFLRTVACGGACYFMLSGSAAFAQSGCYGLTAQDIDFSHRTLSRACARGPNECYGAARNWQNIVRRYNGRLCDGTDPNWFNQRNTEIFQMIQRLGQDRARVARYEQDVADYNRPRGGGLANGAPRSPNPSGVYGTQPNWVYCSNFTFNNDGTKNCY